MRLCAADFLRSALQLLRYRVRLLRGEETNTKGDRGCCGSVSLSSHRDHRWRTVAPEKCAAVDVDVVRRGLHGIAGDQRGARYFESRSARPSDHGFENAGERRSGKEPLVEHRPSHIARRSEVCDGIARRLRMVARKGRALRSSFTLPCGTLLTDFRPNRSPPNRGMDIGGQTRRSFSTSDAQIHLEPDPARSLSARPLPVI